MIWNFILKLGAFIGIAFYLLIISTCLLSGRWVKEMDPRYTKEFWREERRRRKENEKKENSREGYTADVPPGGP